MKQHMKEVNEILLPIMRNMGPLPEMPMVQPMLKMPKRSRLYEKKYGITIKWETVWDHRRERLKIFFMGRKEGRGHSFGRGYYIDPYIAPIYCRMLKGWKHFADKWYGRYFI